MGWLSRAALSDGARRSRMATAMARVARFSTTARDHDWMGPLSCRSTTQVAITPPRTTVVTKRLRIILALRLGPCRAGDPPEPSTSRTPSLGCYEPADRNLPFLIRENRPPG